MVAPRHVALKARDVGGNVAGNDGGKERFLAREPSIDGRLARAGDLRDLVDAGAGKSPFEKYSACRIQNACIHLSGKFPPRPAGADGRTGRLRQQEAAVESAQATLRLAQRQVEGLNAQRANAVATLAQAKAQRDQAQLNLSYTTVVAAQAGRVVNLTAAVGQFAQPGTNLAMFVPDEIWITANFKETQLDAMRPGQQVAVEIDAYPGRSIRGHVASVQPGSGTAFSLLPAQNATGNYVKIVQRVPVKIVMDQPPADVALGPGMSVVPTVRINAAPSLYERLGRWI
jgi:multidrug resistance efflux pump